MNNQFIAPYLRKRWEDARKKVQTLSPELFPQSSYLRIDQTLVNGVGNYVFDPMRQNGQQGTYGQLLNRNDLFLAYGMGLFLIYEMTANPGSAVLATSLSDLVAKAKVMGSTDTIPVDVQCVYGASFENRNDGNIRGFGNLHLQRIAPSSQQRNNRCRSRIARQFRTRRDFLYPGNDSFRRNERTDFQSEIPVCQHIGIPAGKLSERLRRVESYYARLPRQERISVARKLQGRRERLPRPRVMIP